jgi:hypothetical protein
MADTGTCRAGTGWLRTAKAPRLRQLLRRQARRLACLQPDQARDHSPELITASPRSAPEVPKVPGNPVDEPEASAAERASTCTSAHHAAMGAGMGVATSVAGAAMASVQNAARMPPPPMPAQLQNPDTFLPHGPATAGFTFEKAHFFQVCKEHIDDAFSSARRQAYSFSRHLGKHYDTQMGQPPELLNSKGDRVVANGPDMTAQGTPVQTKLASPTSLKHLAKGGRYRYPNQKLTVPSDRHEAAVSKVVRSMDSEQVSGVSDPAEAHKMVRASKLSSADVQQLHNPDSTAAKAYNEEVRHETQRARKVLQTASADAVPSRSVIVAQAAALAGAVTFGMGVAARLTTIKNKESFKQAVQESAPPALHSSAVAGSTQLLVTSSVGEVVQGVIGQAGAVALAGLTIQAGCSAASCLAGEQSSGQLGIDMTQVTLAYSISMLGFTAGSQFTTGLGALAMGAAGVTAAGTAPCMIPLLLAGGMGGALCASVTYSAKLQEPATKVSERVFGKCDDTWHKQIVDVAMQTLFDGVFGKDIAQDEQTAVRDALTALSFRRTLLQHRSQAQEVCSENL